MGILKKGKMINKNLAAWLGIPYKYYMNHRKEKLEELKSFVKEMDKIDDEIFLREVRRTGNMLSSVTGIANKLI